MASLRSRTRSLVRVEINHREICAAPGETLLQAALRNGIAFPNSCRVGGCGTCKCKLTDGKVKELTETGYLLSADEIDAGYILACQSVPRSDLRIEVDVSGAAGRGTPGRIVAQEKLTHDITALTVQLEHELHYKAGQFANLSVDGVAGVARSYSFASPARSDGRVRFFVKRVPGGQLSTLVNDTELGGRAVRLDGPAGDFWLRPGTAPLLLVAGGSGLAPILAILQAALAAGDSRPVTLLFGARDERDLYALDEIAGLARQWRARFRFVPVLSAAAPDCTFAGARGLVTEHIAALLEPGAHAYLCGPPAMIDGAIALLEQHGVDRRHIHFDRFTTRADAANDPLAATPAPRMVRTALRDALHYLKYFGFHVIGLLAVIAILGGFATPGLLSVLALYVLGDAFGGDDTSVPVFRHPGILTAQLWSALPLLSLIVFAAVWSVSPGDPLGFGAMVTRWVGHELPATRDALGLGHHVSVFILTGLMIGLIGTITAHELTHRTWDRLSMFTGRWLLAFSFDTSFAIEHVYGHHRYVATSEDPATAPRGRTVYQHIVLSTIKGNLSAWRIEADRLRKKRRHPFSPHNQVIRGQLMSALLVTLAFALGGVQAMVFFILCGLWGKALLEIVNYMEHYGMVRSPTTPVQPRHSWNTNRRVSSWTTFNLTRHSHHHAQGELPFHRLEPYPNAPVMINGYLTTILIAMIPPLWHRLMTPKVLAWDREHATADERELAQRANALSGLPALGSHAPALPAVRHSTPRS